MNIQIFGKRKCFDTQKALRYFKERRIKVQYIDFLKVGMSDGEYASVKRAVGGVRSLLDTHCKMYETLNLGYITMDDDDLEEKMFDHLELFKTPIVRNGRQATVGYHPEIWQTWE